MAIQFMENFSTYGVVDASANNLMEDGLYAAAGVEIIPDPDGISSGYVARMGPGLTLRRVLTGTLDTVGTGFRVYFAILPSNNNQSIIRFRDSANNDQVTLTAGTTGTLQVRRGSDGGTVIAETTGPVITAQAWHHIQIQVVFSNTVGSVEVKVNNITVCSATLVDTQGTSVAGCAQMYFGATSVTNSYFHAKDWIVWDGTGSSNNTFIGDVKILTLLPNADNSFNWTPSSGTTGYNLIDEGYPDDADDTDYITADDTLPAASVFELEDLPPDIISVKGLMTVVRAIKSASGDAQMQVSLVSNGDEDTGTDRPVTVAQTFWTDVSELDPDTGAAWTPAAVNAAKLKIDRTL
jgi:hypothetical protein